MGKRAILIIAPIKPKASRFARSMAVGLLACLGAACAAEAPEPVDAAAVGGDFFAEICCRISRVQKWGTEYIVGEKARTIVESSKSALRMEIARGGVDE